jgi:hypothetical protein
LKDRRFVAQQVIRSGRFDSFLVGTSTIHSVDPDWAEAAFGGDFANLAIHGATPYETAKVVTLIAQSVPNLRRIVLGLDAEKWCSSAAPPRYHDKALFPDALYDSDRVNDLPMLLNGKMLEFALRQLVVDLKLRPAPVPADGYRNELDESKWKPFNPGPDNIATLADGKESAIAQGQDAERNFPALQLLEQALGSLPEEAKLIAVLMPPYVSTIPSEAEERARLDLCKQRIAVLAGRTHDDAVDFDIPSPWTASAENYWDKSHFRMVIAKALMQRVKEAVERRRDAEDGVYHFLAGAAAAASR